MRNLRENFKNSFENWVSHWPKYNRKTHYRRDFLHKFTIKYPHMTVKKRDFSWNQPRTRQNRPGAEIKTHRTRHITEEIFIRFFLDSSETEHSSAASEMFLLRIRLYNLTCISSRVSEEISTRSQTQFTNISEWTQTIPRANLKLSNSFLCGL